MAKKHKFSVGGVSYTATEKETLKHHICRLLCGDEELASVTLDPDLSSSFAERHLVHAIPEGDLLIRFGNIGLFKTACIVELDGEIIYRSHKDDFRVPEKAAALFKKLDDLDKNAEQVEKTPEQIAREEDLKSLRPSIAVDFALGFIFFFVAREFGIVTAAIAGSLVTIGLFIVQKFVKIDLLGGFAVFGLVMALISLGLTFAFQDELFVKLKGTLMGMIGVTFATVDGLNGGKYLGVRMCRYMGGLFNLKPQKAVFAMAGSSLLIILIELTLVFTLTTDQWIWYNSFFDTLVFIPIFFGAMWLAREKKPALAAG